MSSSYTFKYLCYHLEPRLYYHFYFPKIFFVYIFPRKHFLFIKGGYYRRLAAKGSDGVWVKTKGKKLPISLNNQSKKGLREGWKKRWSATTTVVFLPSKQTVRVSEWGGGGLWGNRRGGRLRGRRGMRRGGGGCWDHISKVCSRRARGVWRWPSKQAWAQVC